MPTPASHATQPTTRLQRRALVQAAAWSIPTVVVATAAPVLAASPGTVADASVSSATYGTPNKTYNFNVSVASGSQPITTLAIRFTLDATYSSAAYDTSSQPAAPAGWTRTTLSSGVTTFTYGTSPVPTPTTINAIFQSLRLNNNDSRVFIDVLVTSGGVTTQQDRITVTFVGNNPPVIS